jgi:RNA polymerase sigma-70 factor (ECF subfamily)
VTAEVSVIVRLKRGDVSAFDVIYEEWRPRIFGFLVRQLGDRLVAEDLLQETFLRLTARRATLRDDTDIGAWLFTVARRLAVSHGRWRRFTSAALAVAGRVPAANMAAAPFDETAAREVMAQLENALLRLPPAHREVLLLIAVEGMDAEHAAAVIGIRPEALRQRLSRARALLTVELAEASPSIVAMARPGESR